MVKKVYLLALLAIIVLAVLGLAVAYGGAREGMTATPAPKTASAKTALAKPEPKPETAPSKEPEGAGDFIAKSSLIPCACQSDDCARAAARGTDTNPADRNSLNPDFLDSLSMPRTNPQAPPPDFGPFTSMT